MSTEEREIGLDAVLAMVLIECGKDGVVTLSKETIENFTGTFGKSLKMEYDPVEDKVTVGFVWNLVSE